NVLIAANGRDCPQVTQKCRANTIEFLQDFLKEGVIVLDNQWLILTEYKHKVNSTGQPNLGDAFLKWILTNLANSQRCQQIKIHRLGDDNFVEFPDDPELEKFDRSDRKFVAVALADPDHPPIVNAVDTDWLESEIPLTRNGVKIKFLCRDLVVSLLKNKHP
ncbi:MAG: hypothetical protein ACRC6M_12945, partial [Microcystaceae cyanobacterium]